MGYTQLVTPNPNIPCEPGMCLQYVRQTFGAPIVEPTATAGWNNAKYQHTDMNFPDGVWVPLWFAIPGIPAGHVVLRAPDGSIYSTSDEATVPHHHPSLDDLIWYYGPRVQPEYQLELQYLGWTEDISGVRVVQEFSIDSESTTTIQEDDLAFSEADLIRIIGTAVQPFVDELTRRTNAQQVESRTQNEAQHIETRNVVINGTQAQSDVTRGLVLDKVPAAVLNLSFSLPDGTVTNLAGILGALNAKPTGGAADATAIAAAVVDDIKTQWKK